VLAEQRGELELAYSQIKDLAKPESSVAYEAHLWVAQHIDSGQIEQDNPQAAQLLKDALRAAIAQRDTEPGPRIWLAQLYAAEGKHDDVTELLSRLHLQWLSPGQRLQVAGLLRATGDRLEASRVARSVLTHYEVLAQAADSEPLSAQDASMWAAAYEILDDYPKAVEVAAKALVDHPDDDDLRTGAMKLAEHALRVAAARGALGVRDRWLVLDRMLEFAPDRGKVLEYIARLADTPQEAERVAELLEAEYSAGTLPASVCRKLGDLAVIKSDNSLARSWYSRAVEI
ncbi:MAG: hypothetical protein KDA92_26800, partial [Planctomycetales bacterium]|nr:hypothetical protein [Planctomycetales bacterium]